MADCLRNKRCLQLHLQFLPGTNPFVVAEIALRFGRIYSSYIVAVYIDNAPSQPWSQQTTLTFGGKETPGVTDILATK